LGLTLFAVSADRLPSDPRDLDAFARLIERESALAGSAVLVEADDHADGPATALDQLVATLTAPVLVGTREPRRIPHRAAVAVEPAAEWTGVARGRAARGAQPHGARGGGAGRGRGRGRAGPRRALRGAERHRQAARGGGPRQRSAPRPVQIARAHLRTPVT